MALTLARGETILFPMPYVEAEHPPFVVTNQRLIEHGEAGERVLEVRQLLAASRAKSRPYAAMGALFICLGLGVGAVGGYFTYKVAGMEAAPYSALWPGSTAETEEAADAAPASPVVAELPDDPSAEHPVDAAWQLEVLKTRLTGMGLLGAGFLLALVGLRVLGKRRYFVVCRTRDSFMRIRVNDKVQQDIILATLQAVQ